MICKSLDLTYEVLNPKPCLATELLKLRFSVKNPFSRAVENVKVNIVDFSVEELHFSALDKFSDFNDSISQWNVGTLLAGETKTIDIGIKSPINYLSFGVYISSVEDLRWQDYGYAAWRSECGYESASHGNVHLWYPQISVQRENKGSFPLHA